MGPGLDGEIGLCVQPHSQNHYGQKAGDVARKLPVFPLARLARRWRGSVEEVPVRLLLMARGRPSARSGMG